MTPESQRGSGLSEVVAEWRTEADKIVSSAEVGQLWAHDKARVDTLRACADRLDSASVAGGGEVVSDGIDAALRALRKLRHIAEQAHDLTSLALVNEGIGALKFATPAAAPGVTVNVPYEKVTRVAPYVDIDSIALEAATDICAMGLCHSRSQLVAQMQVRIRAALTAALETPK